MTTITSSNSQLKFPEQQSPVPKQSKYDWLFQVIEGTTLVDTPERRIYALRQYIPQLRRALSKKISESYCFKPGVQKNDAHFQSLFIECFSRMRGAETLVKEASHSLVKKFEYYPDVCKRSETVMDGGDYDDTVMVSRVVTPELRGELFSSTAGRIN